MSMKRCWAVMIFLKIDVVKATLYLECGLCMFIVQFG